MTDRNWISVKDRLPDLDIEVLSYNGEKQFVASRWELGKEIFFKPTICALYDEGYNEEITHWMPLPNPPEES